MLRNSDGETEILLGNKQLLGIFFVVAVLLGIAFAGGYKVGQGSHKPTTTSTEEASTATSTAGGETHSLPGDASPQPSTTDTSSASQPQTSTSDETATTAPPTQQPAAEQTPAEQPPAPPAKAKAPERETGSFAPQAGQTFLQVAAVSRDEAEAMADVLHKRGFRAHAVPKPGNSKTYRVIVGPMRDATDLNNTRSSLRAIGFREIFVQRY